MAATLLRARLAASARHTAGTTHKGIASVASRQWHLECNKRALAQRLLSDAEPELLAAPRYSVSGTAKVVTSAGASRQ